MCVCACRMYNNEENTHRMWRRRRLQTADNALCWTGATRRSAVRRSFTNWLACGRRWLVQSSPLIELLCVRAPARGRGITFHSSSGETKVGPCPYPVSRGIPLQSVVSRNKGDNNNNNCSRWQFVVPTGSTMASVNHHLTQLW